MINIEVSTLLQDIVGGPPGVYLPTEDRDQVTAAGDLADGDN